MEVEPLHTNKTNEGMLYDSFKKNTISDLTSQISYCKEFKNDNAEFNLVLPGDLITDEKGFIQGGGTYEENEKIYSSMIGHVIRTNKLISVAPLKNRYKGTIGDLVVGRVKEIMGKKWKIDIDSYELATLNLNAVKLPEIQRRKTEEDERKMREFLCEGDLVVAEIQGVSSQDKSISLHIKSNKYGKLDKGILVKVCHNLINRSKMHYIELNAGITIIMAMNGNIWLKPSNDKELSKELFQTIAKFKNLLGILNENFIGIKSELL